MIDVKKTILKAINKAFDNLRFLGENDPQHFKNILYLIALDDIYDWSDYLNESQSVLKKLLELRTQFIMCHPELTACRFEFDNHYTNVNVPQSSSTWKRVWDAPNVVIIDTTIEPGVNPDIKYDDVPYTPDPTCTIQFTYFGEGTLIPKDKNGKPYIDLNSLTVCEKMNIYIDRETGAMYYLVPETGKWERIKAESATDIDWEHIHNKPIIYQGILHGIANKKLTVELQETGEIFSDLPVTDSNPDPNENEDLNDIL